MRLFAPLFFGAILLPFFVSMSSGCGGDDESETKPVPVVAEQTFDFGAEELALDFGDGAEQVPSVTCSDDAGCSLEALQLTCQGSYECEPSCGDNGTCEITTSARTNSDWDISADLQREVGDAAVDAVTVEQLSLDISENTLSYETQLDLYVGWPNEELVPLANRAVASGETFSGNLELTEEGKATLAEILENAKTSFVFDVRVTHHFLADQPLPSGSISLKFALKLQVTTP